MNKWSEIFDVPYPECKGTGQCCRCASPSSPYSELLKKASENDEFARDFISIFIPYESIEEARKVNPAIVQRSLEMLAKDKSNKVSAEDLVFYHCRYIADDNRCLIHEDRPVLCRDFPDTPFLIIPSGCSYEEWSKVCKEKYNSLQEELKKLKGIKKDIEDIKYQQRVSRLVMQIARVNNKDYNFILLAPALSLVSPGKSWMKTF